MGHPEGWKTHRICEDCWKALVGDIKPPRASFDLANCCRCGNLRNLDIEVPGIPRSEIKCEVI